MAAEKRVDSEMFRVVFDALPALIFVVDEDVRVQDYNAAVADFLTTPESAVLKRRSGEVLRCLHSTDVPAGCGRAPFCKGCIIRSSVGRAFAGDRVVRRRTRMELIRAGGKQDIYALITAAPFCYRDKSLVLLVIEDISEIAELQRLIPICSICKKVRDDKESWSRLEAYFKENWDVDFTHGLCPECYKIEVDKVEKYFKATRSRPADG